MFCLGGTMFWDTWIVYIEKCIRNIIDTQTRKMEEMKDTVKALRQDEAELMNKI